MPSFVVSGVCRLTRDSEISLAKNGTSAWLKLGLAAYRKYAKEGQQDVDFYDGEYYMKNASCGLEKMLVKGRQIYLDRAELRNDQFMGTDGKKKSKIKVLIFSFDFLDKKPEAAKEETVEIQVGEPAKVDVSEATDPVYDNLKKTVGKPEVSAADVAQMYGKPETSLPVVEDDEEEIPF